MPDLNDFRKWIHDNPNLMQNGPQGHKVTKERFLRHNGYFVHIANVKGPNILNPESSTVVFTSLGVYKYNRHEQTFEYAGNNIRETTMNNKKIKDILEKMEVQTNE